MKNKMIIFILLFILINFLYIYLYFFRYKSVEIYGLNFPKDASEKRFDFDSEIFYTINYVDDFYEVNSYKSKEKEFTIMIIYNEMILFTINKIISKNKIIFKHKANYEKKLDDISFLILYYNANTHFFLGKKIDNDFLKKIMNKHANIETRNMDFELVVNSNEKKCFSASNSEKIKCTIVYKNNSIIYIFKLKENSIYIYDIELL